ncbi:MAG: sigma-54-dependent Fis family transcriptional regulator [Planctomycetota bacterium]|nr:MAG: sigma-54-dependent Fis family transcriptional regulator [Planctomycetota bacterium]
MEVVADLASLAIENARLERLFMEKNRQIQELSEQLLEKVDAQTEELARMRELVEAYEREELRFVGVSEAFEKILRTIEVAKDSSLPVLIQGPSGSGKELVARALHFRGRRRNFPFLSLNCGAMPVDLLESELFGYAKGAFSGAYQSKKGLLEQVGRGSIFLDEVGDLSLENQAKLLRVLEQRRVRPIGSSRTVEIRCRFIAATNRDLKALVRSGDFREDLYYRLLGISISIPPLCERSEDIPLLLEFFFKKYSSDSLPRITRSAYEALVGYIWPGNVRQLENEVRRLCLLYPQRVCFSSLSSEIKSHWHRRKSGGSFGSEPPQSLEYYERKAILEALRFYRGNRVLAAKALGISRSRLYRKLGEYRLSEFRFDEVE